MCIRDRCFSEDYVCVVTGSREENDFLLGERWDKIFFTGSAATGRRVMAAAAEHLTPVTLELGGKSPVIVDGSADIRLAAKRIAFGKLLNCGQTCVAPDYVLCDAKVHDELTEALCREFAAQCPDALNNSDSVSYTHLAALRRRAAVLWTALRSGLSGRKHPVPRRLCLSAGSGGKSPRPCCAGNTSAA